MKPIIRDFEVFRNDPHISQNRHTVGVPFPPGDDMEVKVVLNSGTGRLAQICPNIDTVRGKDHLDELYGALKVLHEGIAFAHAQIFEVSHVT